MYNKYTFRINSNTRTTKRGLSERAIHPPTIMKISARNIDEAERSLEDMLFDFSNSNGSTYTYDLLDTEMFDVDDLL